MARSIWASALWPRTAAGGIGAALLESLEEEARGRGVPRLLANANEAEPFALDWAMRRGYREIGRRIASYVDLASFDPAPFAAALDRMRASFRFAPIADALGGVDTAAQDTFWHRLHEAEGPMWEDIPFATPTSHWPFEQFHRMTVESGRLLPDLSLLAYDGDRIVGLTMTGQRQRTDA